MKKNTKQNNLIIPKSTHHLQNKKPRISSITIRLGYEPHAFKDHLTRDRYG